MPIARFHPQPGAEYRLDVREDQAGALLPHTSGISIPLEGGPLTAGGGRLTWDISYLYAELWSLPKDGRQLIGVALAEFTTDSQRPTAVRVPLTPNEVAMIEDLRRGGDVRLLLHLQATFLGTVPRHALPDPGRRQALETAGLENDIFGPVRRNDDVPIRIDKWAWQEEILPQWRGVETLPAVEPVWIATSTVATNPAMDVQALARSLQGASPDANISEIISQCRAPIVGL